MSNLSRIVNPRALVIRNENGRPLQLTRAEALPAIKEGRIRLFSSTFINPILADFGLWQRLPKEVQNALISDWALVNTFLMQTRNGKRFSDIHSDCQDIVSVYIPGQFRNDKNTRLTVGLAPDNFTLESYKGRRLLLHFNDADILQSACSQNGRDGQERHYATPNSDLARLMGVGAFIHINDRGRFVVSCGPAYAGKVSGERYWVLEENTTAIAPPVAATH